MNTSRIAINGFFGRMGQAIYNLSKEEKFNVTVGCDQKDKINLEHEVLLTDDLSNSPESFDVVIDFSLPVPSINTVKICEAISKPITIGTTGFNDDQKHYLISASKSIPLLLAPNMSLGVNASLKSIFDLSKILSNYDISIEETHHRNKVDSPSGTALKIAEVVAKARGIEPDKIDIKSNREDGEIGVHKTIFKSKDDEIIVFHNAFNRTIFATGALETSQWIAKQEPGLYTYKDFMDSVK
jgi:4-hydroxy-tetrahydrodipicolinate reductase